MPAPRHQVFTVTYGSGDDSWHPITVTCTCGETQTLETTHQAINWFGEHCFTAALDRAIAILKS